MGSDGVSIQHVAGIASRGAGELVEPSSVKSASIVEALRFVSIKSHVSGDGGWNVKSFYGLEKQNQFTALGDNNFVVPVENKEKDHQVRDSEKKNIGRRSSPFHFSRIRRIKLISKRSFLPPSVDVVRVSFLLPFVFLSSRVNLLQFGFLGNS